MATSLSVAAPQELAQWLEDAQDGSARAWNQLLAFCWFYLRERGAQAVGPDMRAKVDPEDLIQETLLQFHQCFHRLHDLTPESALAFLLQIWMRERGMCRRRLYRLRRRVSREEAQVEGGWDEEGSGAFACGGQEPWEVLQAEEEWQQLEKIWATLTEDERDLLRWHDQEGLSYKEIGERLGITEGAARLRHWHLIQRLRKRWRAAD